MTDTVTSLRTLPLAILCDRLRREGHPLQIEAARRLEKMTREIEQLKEQEALEVDFRDW